MEFKSDNSQQNSLAHVYIAQFPFAVEGLEIAPEARAKEIESCANPNVRSAKFYVWKLLESALGRSLGLNISELDIKKNESGKWECPECFFSLSHSGNLVAAAVSMKPVGIDIERKNEARFTPSLAHKMLACREAEAIERLDEAEKGSALNVLWTKKEALFKLSGEGAFLPHKVETSDGNFITKGIKCGEEQYILTVASENADCTEFHLGDNLELMDI